MQNPSNVYEMLQNKGGRGGTKQKGAEIQVIYSEKLETKIS
jgi:hypothetical protein